MQFWMIAVPVISALIGYCTIWLGIRLLFHPRQPVYIFGIRIQGIVPGNKTQWTEKLGKMVSAELLETGDLEVRLSHPDSLARLMPAVETHIDHFLQNKLPEAFPMISMFIGEKTIATLKQAFMDELNSLFPTLMRDYAGMIKNELVPEQLLTSRIAALFAQPLEKLFQKHLNKALRMVAIMASLLGFLAGLVQVAIVLFTR